MCVPCLSPGGAVFISGNCPTERERRMINFQVFTMFPPTTVMLFLICVCLGALRSSARGNVCFFPVRLNDTKRHITALYMFIQNGLSSCASNHSTIDPSCSSNATHSLHFCICMQGWRKNRQSKTKSTVANGKIQDQRKARGFNNGLFCQIFNVITCSLCLCDISLHGSLGVFIQWMWFIVSECLKPLNWRSIM